MATSHRKRALPTTANLRLKQDFRRLIKDPVPYIIAAPCLENILEWHYVITGPENSPYEGGFYHGKLVFPAAYPFKPPSIYIITPNGRFKCNQRLCLSISDFHPDTWNPAWSVSTILTGLLSFMLEDHATLGSITTTTEMKRCLAMESLTFNLRDAKFCELFPELAESLKEIVKERQSGIADKMKVNSNSATALDAMDSTGNVLKHLLVLGAVAAIGYGLKIVIAHASETDQLD